MKQRTISAIVLLVIMIGALVIDTRTFGVLMILCAIMGFHELFEIKYHGVKNLLPVKILGIVSLLVLLINNSFYHKSMAFSIALPLILILIPIIFYNNKSYDIMDAFYVLSGVYLLGLSFGNIAFLSISNVSKCIFIFIIAFISDTYAYIGGSLIGRHKLTSISPKKTIEGSLIGLIMATVVGSVYYYNLIGRMTIPQVLIMCLFLTLLSEMGDLFFSGIKRTFNKKDYSNLIPGHGGVLDRFDSVIFVSIGLYLISCII